MVNLWRRLAIRMSRCMTVPGIGCRLRMLAALSLVALDFAGVKLFYRQDTGLFTPAQVLGLRPQPVVVIYQ
jgi:hypothetical protein